LDPRIWIAGTRDITAAGLSRSFIHSPLGDYEIAMARAIS
jgi:hypothetical protein